MARRQKSLEDQLSSATEKRNRTQILLSECEKEIKSIKQQIENRNMREMYSYAKGKGITIEDLKKAFSPPKKESIKR